VLDYAGVSVSSFSPEFEARLLELIGLFVKVYEAAHQVERGGF